MTVSPKGFRSIRRHYYGANGHVYRYYQYHGTTRFNARLLMVSWTAHIVQSYCHAAPATQIRKRPKSSIATTGPQLSLLFTSGVRLCWLLLPLVFASRAGC